MIADRDRGGLPGLSPLGNHKILSQNDKLPGHYGFDFIGGENELRRKCNPISNHEYYQMVYFFVLYIFLIMKNNTFIAFKFLSI